jgi:hypothetical protein
MFKQAFKMFVRRWKAFILMVTVGFVVLRLTEWALLWEVLFLSVLALVVGFYVYAKEYEI